MFPLHLQSKGTMAPATLLTSNTTVAVQWLKYNMGFRYVVREHDTMLVRRVDDEIGEHSVLEVSSANWMMEREGWEDLC